MNVKSFLEAQNLLYQASRDFFKQRNFTEIHSPILVGCGGAEIHLDFFESTWTDHNLRPHLLDLRTSPEIYLKTLASNHGLEKIFEIGSCFRNVGEFSQWHRPEFKMLEWYAAHTGLDEMMNTTEDYLIYTCEKLSEFKFEMIKTRWESKLFKNIPRWSLEKCFKEFLGISLDSKWQANPRDFYRELKQKTLNASIQETDDFETLFFKIMLDEIEPKLKNFPVIFLYNYPAATSALSKLSSDGWAKRFEAYVEGIELCNAFDEIVDPNENRKRCNDILNSRNKLKATSVNKLDIQKNFIDEMNLSFEKTTFDTMTGNALGLDRWLLILLGIDFDQRDKLFGNPIY